MKHANPVLTAIAGRDRVPTCSPPIYLQGLGAPRCQLHARPGAEGAAEQLDPWRGSARRDGRGGGRGGRPRRPRLPGSGPAAGPGLLGVCRGDRTVTGWRGWPGGRPATRHNGLARQLAACRPGLRGLACLAPLGSRGRCGGLRWGSGAIARPLQGLRGLSTIPSA